MPNEQKNILESWTTLKQKLLTTLTELRTNHKNKWAVVKSKSPLKSVQIFKDSELNILRRRIAERKDLIENLNFRPRHELLAPEHQVTLDQALNEVEELERKQTALLTQVEPLPKFPPKTEYFEQLQALHEKHDQLNDKLNWLRTLVRAGDIKQLQALVSKAQI